MEVTETQYLYGRSTRKTSFLEGNCTQYNLPSIDTINKSLRNKIGMSREKISSIPSEYLANTDKVDEYLAITSHVDPTSLHFFDEASVIKPPQIVRMDTVTGAAKHLKFRAMLRMRRIQ